MGFYQILVRISKGMMREKLIMFVILSACLYMGFLNQDIETVRYSAPLFKFFFSLKLQEPDVKKLEDKLQGGQIEEVILQVKKKLNIQIFSFKYSQAQCIQPQN